MGCMDSVQWWSGRFGFTPHYVSQIMSVTPLRGNIMDALDFWWAEELGIVRWWEYYREEREILLCILFFVKR